MVAAALVRRDFENQVQKYGDVVNTRRVGEFKLDRKNDGIPLNHQAAISQNVQVPLNQWFVQAFTIFDGEGSLSFKDLVEQYLTPAVQAIARSADRAVLGRVHDFLGTPAKRVGRLQKLDANVSKDYVLEAREILNVNKAPNRERRLVLSPNSETALLKNELFIKANERGDGGTALEEARLGRILGFDTFMDQNVNAVHVGLDTDAALVVTSAKAKDTGGSQTVSGLTGEVTVGEFLVVDGNDQPTWITAATENMGNTNGVTLNENNKYATLSSAATVRYLACDVDGSYPAGYSRKITVDGYTGGRAPQVGQLIAFGTTPGTRHTYTVIESEDEGSECKLLLDRPLDRALTNNDNAFPGPAGSMNWAFHRDAIALVNRPLALPRNTDAFVATYNNLSMRVAMQYDIDAGGTKVVVDMLCGTAILDDRLCVVVQG